MKTLILCIFRKRTQYENLVGNNVRQSKTGKFKEIRNQKILKISQSK